jgi:hypothetical protein
VGVVRDDLRDRGVPVEHCQRPTAAHLAQVLAEMRLQVRDAHSLHDLIMVMTGHIVKASAHQRRLSQLDFARPGPELQPMIEAS